MTASAGEPEDPHVAWWGEERRLLAAMDEVSGNDDEFSRLNDLRWEVRELIVTTPATTVAGMATQIRLMSLWGDEGFDAYGDLYDMLERVADRLDAMAGRA